MESKMDSKIGRVCVYCGASSGNKPVYKRAAIDLGLELVKRRMDLVYGGGSIGLMGQVARVVHSAGRHVLGVLPKKVLPEEIVGNTVGEVRYVEDMHQRKEQMAHLADAFIALPGGYGTMEELLEIITWSQLGIHNKPIGLLNVDGYYNLFLALIDNAVEEGFISADARKIIIHASNATDLLCKLEKAYSCIHIPICSNLIESNSTPETLRVGHYNHNQIEIDSNCLNVVSNEGLPLPISLQISLQINTT